MKNMSMVISLNDIISHIVAFLLGAALTYLGYRLQMRSLAKDRLSPHLERTLRIVKQIAGDSREAKDLWNRASEYQKALSIEKEVRPLSQSFAWGLLSIVSISSMQRLIENCKEYELVYSELEKSGMIERVRLCDFDLADELFWIHEESQKILISDNFLDWLSVKRNIESISERARRAQKKLEKFLK
jgi:hypothetical protein